MASAYDKASLVMLPNAYKDGKLYSVKPEPVYGSELIALSANRDFSSNTGFWTFESPQVTYGTGKADFNTSLTNYGFYKTSFLVPNKSYIATFDIVNYTSGAVHVNGGGLVYGSANSNGTHRISLNSNANGTFAIQSDSGGAVLSIDNVSVKEVLSGDGNFTFTRGSDISATRVGADGLIEKGRENLLLQSNQFDTTWVKTGYTLTSGQSGYDGSNDAWLAQCTSAGQAIYQTSNASGVTTFSVYLKQGTANFLRLRADQSADAIAVFDLSNGSVHSSNSNVIKANVVDLGSGWYRCLITWNIDTLSNVQIRAEDGNGSPILGTFYIQDAQLEQSLVSTEYIESGATTGTAGILENTPRFNYSFGASCPSLLLEPSRTQLITQSEYFGGYTKISISVDDNSTISPEGVENAAKLIESSDASASSHYVRGNSFAVVTNTIYTFSVFAKTNGRGIQIRAQNASGSFATVLVSYDLTLGVIDGNGDSNAEYIDSDIEDYGNGWYRCSLQMKFTDSGNTLGRFTAYTYNESINSHSYVGDGTSGIYIYGAQIELGTYLTSYIPTYGTSQSRAAEVCVTETPSTTLFGQTEGTVFCEYTPVSDDTTNVSRFFRLSNSGNSNQIYMQHEASNKITAVVFNGSNQFVGQTSTGYVSVGNTYKFALAYKNGDYAFYANGVQITVGTATGLGTLAVDRLGLTNSVIGKSSKVKQGIVFNTRLTNAELAKLTTV